MLCATTLAVFTEHDEEEYNAMKRKVSQDSVDKDRRLQLRYILKPRDGQTLASCCHAHSMKCNSKFFPWEKSHRFSV